MSSLNVRRLIVWLVSLGLGFVITYLLVTVGFPLVKPESAGITLAKFGFGYFILIQLHLSMDISSLLNLVNFIF